MPVLHRVDRHGIEWTTKYVHGCIRTWEKYVSTVKDHTSYICSPSAQQLVSTTDGYLRTYNIRTWVGGMWPAHPSGSPRSSPRIGVHTCVVGSRATTGARDGSACLRPRISDTVPLPIHGYARAVSRYRSVLARLEPSGTILVAGSLVGTVGWGWTHATLGAH